MINLVDQQAHSFRTHGGSGRGHRGDRGVVDFCLLDAIHANNDNALENGKSVEEAHEIFDTVRRSASTGHHKECHCKK